MASSGSPTSDGNRPTVFISYSRDDLSLRDDVVHYLESNGFEPIFDERNFTVGADWRHQINSYIDSSDVLLVLMTSAAALSPWVLAEVIWGVARGKEPVILLESEVEMPDPIEYLNAVKIDTILGDPLTAAITANRTMSRVTAQLRQRSAASVEQRSLRSEKEMLLSDGTQTLRSIVLGHVERNPNPDLKRLGSLVREMVQEGLFDEERYLRPVVRKEMESQGHSLSAVPLNQLQDAHTLQWRWGRLLSQVKDDRDLLEITDPIDLAGSRIRACKYLLTKRIYHLISEKVGATTFHNDVRPWTEEDNEPWIPQTDHLQGVRLNMLENELAKIGGSLEEYYEIQLKKKVTVRLPTIEEWSSIASPPSDGWTYKRLQACNLTSDGVRSTRLSAVGIYPASCSDHGCFDVIGNAWELCRKSVSDRKLYIAGWCHESDAQDVETQWDRIIPLSGKRSKEPVALRFIVEEMLDKSSARRSR